MGWVDNWICKFKGMKNDPSVIRRCGNDLQKNVPMKNPKGRARRANSIHEYEEEYWA